MKKKVLCITWLLLYLLVACTFLSQGIEEMMKVEVLARKVGSSPLNLSASSLYEEGGKLFLYELIEGSGWDSGLRISKSGQSYPAGLEEISVGSNAPYVVQAASRKPREGEVASVLSRQTISPDQYLLVYPGEAPVVEEFSENLTILFDEVARGENTILLDVQNSFRPFMEHYAQGKLKDYAIDGWRIYSLVAFTQLMEQLPKLAVLALLLLIPVFLWIYGCFLMRNPRRHIGCLCACLVITALLLGCMVYVLQSVNLPSSLLPLHNILDWGHYSREVSVIVGALEGLGEETADVLASARRMMTAAQVILAAGAALSAGLVLASGLVLRKRK